MEIESFVFGEGTEVYRSCSTTLNGQMLVFGGSATDSDQKTQISVVEDCGLRRIGSLPMEFFLGACNTYSVNEEDVQVLLCFASRDFDGCHR